MCLYRTNIHFGYFKTCNRSIVCINILGPQMILSIPEVKMAIHVSAFVILIVNRKDVYTVHNEKKDFELCKCASIIISDMIPFIFIL